MANKPKSALAALLDNINNSNDELSTVESTTVDLPTIDSNETTQYSSFTTTATSYNLDDSMQILGAQLISVDPNDCHLWQFADRPNDEVGDIKSLAKSMKVNGQQEPILIRPNSQNTRHKYEIIFGNRRWQAAKYADINLTAILKSISDQEASLFQKEENENRKDLSDYARAKSYRRQIENGVFKSESELSKYLHISKVTLNDIMSYLRIPESIVNAIPEFKNISRAMAVKLAVLSKDKKNHKQLIELGPKIGQKKITTANIESQLSTKKVNKANVSLALKSQDGESLASLSQGKNKAWVIKIDKKYAHKKDITEFSKKLERFLRENI